MKFLYTDERDQYIKYIKQAVMRNEDIKVPEEYRYLLEEWQQSAKKGISHEMTELAESTRDMHVFERVDQFDRFRLAYLNDYYTNRDELLASLGCAIFYTYDELSVYRKAGDPDVLADLRARGLRLGSNLAEENVGVFVANMAEKYPGEVICRVGSENYLEMFSDYACFAHWWKEDRRNASGVLLVITPAHNCSDLVRNAVKFLLEVEDVTHDIYYPFTKIRSDLLEASTYYRDAMEIYLSEHGEVVFVNRQFKKTFGKKIYPGPLPGIGQFMPELSYLTRFLDETRNPCTPREVMLLTADKKHSFFQAIPEVIHTHYGTKGIKCTLQPAVKKKKAQGINTNEGSQVRYNFDSIIGESAAMVNLKSYANEVANSRSNVLILGESGTGKELFAQAIHAASKVRNGPFVPINCAALPKELLSSELFGYEEGAFTGAAKGGAQGKFEQANGGTIFLDEIGDMPLDMQSALLRVLEDNTVVRVGGKKYIPVDVRVIAATNQDLWKNVQKGTFRADLYFRLNIITIRIPPLRERKEDIPLLAEHLVMQIREKSDSTGQLSPELLEMFKEYSWPGNVRELRNVVERCLHYARGGWLTPEELPEELQSMLIGTKPARIEPRSVASERTVSAQDWRGYDKNTVLELMQKHGGNKSKVAKELGISRATFYKRLKEYGIE